MAAVRGHLDEIGSRRSGDLPQGFTSLPGAVLGGFALALTENLIGVYISSAFKDVIVFVLLILVLLIRPSGLLGRQIVKRV